MYLKTSKNKKIEIQELISFWERFKSLRFVLEPINYGVRFPKKRSVSTTFLCQRVDIIITDKENTILHMYENFKSEKRIWPKRRAYYIYLLPLGTITHFKTGDKLNLVDDEKKSN